LLGTLNVIGSGTFEAASYTFAVDGPGLDGFVSGLQRDTGFSGEYFARAFIEKRSAGGSGTEYRIHIFSNPDHSEGADHRLTIDDDTTTPWTDGFNWYDLTTDPVLFEGLYPSRRKEYDWTFDSGLGEWDIPALALARTAEINTRNLLWRDTSSEHYFLTGEGSIVEGHNRPTDPLVEDDYSGDSVGVRNRFVGGDLVAEIGTLVASDGAATTVSATVPAFLADPPSTALAVTISGSTFKTSGSSDYIPHTSANGEPIFPVFVQLKWSPVSDWETDGVGGTEYQYASAEVLQVSSDTELIINADSLPTVATSDVTVEVRRGGPVGTILANGDLSNADGRTSSAGSFWVQSASSGSPDIADWAGSGQALEGLSGVDDNFNGTRVLRLDDDVYLAVRSTSASSKEYASEYTYSDWYIAKVVGYGYPGDGYEYNIYVDDGEDGSALLSTTDIEWVLFINPDRRLSLYTGSSGNNAVVVAGSDRIDLVETEELFSSTSGIEIYQPVGANPRLRITDFTDSIKIAEYNVGEGDSITISGAHEKVDGTYPVHSTDSVTMGSEWPVVYVSKDSKVFSVSLLDSSDLYTKVGATVTLSRRANHQIRPDRAECRIVVGENTYIARASEYLSGQVTSSGTAVDAGSTLTSIQVDNVFSTSEDLGSWYSYNVNPEAAATVVFLHTEEYASLAERWGGSGAAAGSVDQANESVTYRAALVDNDYYETYFDTQMELAPDEDVSLHFLASPGIGNRTFRVGGPELDHGSVGGFHLWSSYSTGSYRSDLIVPLFGTLLCEGEAGGAASASPFTGTSSDSSAADYHIFEDLAATFTSDITDLDSNDQPNNPTFVCLTENTGPNESLWEDWIHLIQFTGGTGVLSPRYVTLQVVEVISDTQLLLRFYHVGEAASTNPILAQWFGSSAHLKYSIRDNTGIDTTSAHLLSPAGVWYSLTGVKTSSSDVEDSGLPGSEDATGLTTVTANISSDYPDGWWDSQDYTRRNTVETWYCPYFFTATLTNGSATITPDGSVADFNQFAKEFLVDGCYLQAAPTPFVTLEETDTTNMIADGPVFKAALQPVEDADATITVLAIPASPFTITYDDGSPTVVTVSGSWATVEEVKNAIIMAWPSPAVSVGAGETTPTGSTDALRVFHTAGGSAGNSISLSTSDSTNISLPASLSGGADAIVSVYTGTYSGVTAASTTVVLRATTSPFPISIASASLSDWYTQSSGDTASIDIEEQVPE
jgi:hypothetical protein